jgi:hypothetical protein
VRGRGRRCSARPRASVKQSRSMACSARPRASTKQSRSMACSGAGGDGVLQAKRSRSRAKRSSGVEGEAVEAVTCSGVKRSRVRSVGSGGGVEDLKRATGENLLSVERAARSPDIYIGGQMRDTHSVKRVAHFFGRATHYF